MSTTIIFSKNTPLLPLTRQKVKNLCKTIKEKLTPWRSFKFYSVNITDFYGETYPIGGGCTAYEGTVELSFFNFIVPFLEDAIVNTLDETLEICRLRGLKPEEPYIRETAMILDGYLIDPIYREMADIDRHLRCRDGNLKSVKRRDVTDEIDTMVKFLDKSKDELIQGIKEQNSIRNQPQKKTGQGKTDIPDYRELAKVPVSGLIKYGEGHTLEFKETLEYDIKQNQHNKNLNKECLRTIAAFLNTDGGILLIGVKDNGKVTGIKRDLQYVQRKNLDGFELKLRNLIRDRFTPLPFNGVRIKFEKLVTETICRIVVNPVNRDQIIHLDKEVYIRDGNTTRKLVGRDLTDWIQQRVQASDMGNSN